MARPPHASRNNDANSPNEAPHPPPIPHLKSPRDVKHRAWTDAEDRWKSTSPRTSIDPRHICSDPKARNSPGKIDIGSIPSNKNAENIA